MDDIGNINGKPPVFNDVLAFVYSKMKLCTTSTLVSVISAYYPPEDLKEARDILFALVDPQGHLPRLPNLGCAVVFHMADKYDILHYSFLALDLNHVPCVDVMDKNAVEMFMEHHKVEQQLQAVLAEQAEVRAQLLRISDQLARIHDGKMARHQQVLSSPSDHHCPTPRTQAATSQITSPPTDKSPRPLSPGVSEGAEAPRTLAQVVKQHAPRGYTVDSEGFMSKDKGAHMDSRGSNRKHQHPMVTGTKLREKLRPSVNDIRIFATKFSPEETESDIKAYVMELLGDDCKCKVEKIRARTTRHSSFLVTASKAYESILLDPSSWEEGVQVRHFFGRLSKSPENRTPMISST